MYYLGAISTDAAQSIKQQASCDSCQSVSLFRSSPFVAHTATGVVCAGDASGFSFSDKSQPVSYARLDEDGLYFEQNQERRLVAG